MRINFFTSVNKDKAEQVASRLIKAGVDPKRITVKTFDYEHAVMLTEVGNSREILELEEKVEEIRLAEYREYAYKDGIGVIKVG